MTSRCVSCLQERDEVAVAWKAGERVWETVGLWTHFEGRAAHFIIDHSPRSQKTLQNLAESLEVKSEKDVKEESECLCCWSWTV